MEHSTTVCLPTSLLKQQHVVAAVVVAVVVCQRSK